MSILNKDIVVKDTSKDYEDMVGYISETNLNKGSLLDFIGEKPAEYKPEVKKKELDKNFPEDWQRLMVNFSCEKDYLEFMNKIGSKPIPKLKTLIFERQAEKTGLLNFLE